MRRKEELARCMDRRPDTGVVVHVLVAVDGESGRLGVTDKVQYPAEPHEVRLVMLDDKSVKLVPWCACARVKRNLSTGPAKKRKKKKRKKKSEEWSDRSKP